MSKEAKPNGTRRTDKEGFQGATIYIPRELNDEIAVQAKSQGLTKSAYIIKAAQTLVSIDKGEYSGNGAGTVSKQFCELNEKTDEIITDLRLIKKLLSN